jgi:hypothetical protein
MNIGSGQIRKPCRFKSANRRRYSTHIQYGFTSYHFQLAVVNNFLHLEQRENAEMSFLFLSVPQMADFSAIYSAHNPSSLLTAAVLGTKICRMRCF